ncbi:MAG: hypothetical protein KDA99_10620 [Planctomycetales bacterium]|nr:hypothetical protein [Planctomycetales bacterium]
MNNHFDDKTEMDRRIAAVDRVYAGEKTATYYDTLSAAGVCVERPARLRNVEDDARHTLDQAIANWVVDGNYENVFRALQPLFVRFDYGVLPSAFESAQTSVNTRPLTAEEDRLYPLARTVSHIQDLLMSTAPKFVAWHYGDAIDNQTAERDLGCSWTDLKLHIDIETQRRGRLRANDSDDQRDDRRGHR